jgi:hypothetical protein
MPATPISDWKELASRAGDGLEVSLLWNKAANRVRVAVSDKRFAEHLELDVENRDALAAFRHPFAYAAVRPVDRPLERRPDLNPAIQPPETARLRARPPAGGTQ